MKIRINNRVFDMPLRCFEFSPTAKENTKYISLPGRCSLSVVLTPPEGQKPHKAADRHC